MLARVLLGLAAGVLRVLLGLPARVSRVLLGLNIPGIGWVLARNLASHFGTAHHEVNVSQAEAIGLLTDLVHHQDEPLADPVCIPLHFVCKLAAQNEIKVVLAGEGADELFWGYPIYGEALERWRLIERFLALPTPVRRLLPQLVGDRHARRREFLDQLPDGRPLPLHMPLGMTRRQRRVVLGTGDGAPAPGWGPTGDAAGEDPLLRLMFDTQEYEFSLRLPELLLMRIDRFSMVNSVEARVPFLDPFLVDFAYRLPLEYKHADGRTKVLLRRAIADVVPTWVLERPKQGFGAPVADWASAFTCAASSGFIQCGRSFEGGGVSNGEVVVSSGLNNLTSFVSSRSLKPVPTWPAY